MNMQTPPTRTLLSRADRFRRRGERAEAATIYRDVLARFPGNVQARTGLNKMSEATIPADQLHLVQSHLQAGRNAEALAVAQRLETDAPCHPVLTDLLGVCLRRLGQPEAAVQLYDRALQVRDTAALWSAKAQALLQCGRPRRAAAAFDRATALAPGTAENWWQLAQCHLDAGDADAARNAIAAARGLAPDHPQMLLVDGRVALAFGDADAAQAAFGAALRADPGNAAILNELAILARATGQPEAAEAHYAAALERHPDMAILHRNLSEIARFDGPGDARLQDMHALLERPGIGGPAQAQLHFGLFNGYDQLDDRERAFAHLARGNALRKAELGYDVTRDAAIFGWLKSLRMPRAAMGEKGVSPIFVTGLPRSGTTLTEHVLSQGEDTHPAGELEAVTSAIAPVLRMLQSEGRGSLSMDEVLELQRILRNRLRDHAGGRARIIDKMPLNFRWIGFLRAALPEARFVVVDRDPMALGWSLYRQCFGSAGNGFAYDLADIACYQAIARDLIGHWTASDDGQIVRLDYAALTADPAQTARALRAACGIPEAQDGPGPAIRRPILTASADQVRRPVDNTRDQGWRRYADQLAPLAEALKLMGLAAEGAQGG